MIMADGNTTEHALPEECAYNEWRDAGQARTVVVCYTVCYTGAASGFPARRNGRVPRKRGSARTWPDSPRPTTWPRRWFRSTSLGRAVRLHGRGRSQSGVIVGPDGVVVVDAQATPAMAREVQARIATVTDRPVRQVVLTHYHAVRVLGASGYPAHAVICSEATRDLIVERGQQDMDSEIGRFPRLFRGREGIPGLTWPTQTFRERMTLWLGEREAQVIHVGRAHTAGDTVVWLPKEQVLFAGDTVEFGATPYCGDAHFADWPATIAASARARRREDGAGPRPRAAQRR